MDTPQLLELLADGPVIAAVKDDDGLKRALRSEAPVLFLLYGDILTIRDTVAALRLDAVVAAAFPVSRTVAAELISQGKVLQNGLPQTQPSHTVSPGDRVTVRGRGKFLVGEDLGQTRRGRIHLEIKHFI